MDLAERPFAERPLAAGDGVEHGNDGPHVLAGEKAGTDMLGGAGGDGIGRIDIEIIWVFDIGCDDAAREPADIVEAVREAGKVVEVGQRGCAVVGRRHVEHLNRRPARAVIDPLSADLDIVLGVAAVKHELPRRPGDRVLNEGSGKQETPGVRCAAAARQRLLHDDGGHLAHADLRKHG